MKDLTKTQKNLMKEVYNDIAMAKQFDNYTDYVKATYEVGNKRLQDIEIENQSYKQYWLDMLNNITLTWTSTSTLKALEKKGYIEILKVDDIDKIKVIKF